MTEDGETHEVVAGLKTAVAVESRSDKAFFQMVTGKLDEQLEIIYEAYRQSLPEGTAIKPFPDWKQTVVDFRADGIVESQLPPLDEAALKARGIVVATPS